MHTTAHWEVFESHCVENIFGVLVGDGLFQGGHRDNDVAQALGKGTLLPKPGQDLCVGTVSRKGNHPQQNKRYCVFGRT